MILHAGPEGTFTEHWAIWDQLDLLRQLGAATPDRLSHIGSTKEHLT